MSAEELKAILSTPLALFALMLLASLTSALKQVHTANQSGAEATLGGYLAHWKSTLGTLLGNVIAFVVLIQTDQLNFASALGIGYGVNSVVDMLPKNDRAQAMLGKQGGFASAGMLVLIAVTALLALSACVTPPHKVIGVACTPGTAYSVERCVKGIAETWEVYQIRAELIVADPLTPADVKRGVQEAEAASRPVVVDTLKAGALYADIKQQLAEGKTTEEQLAKANTKLQEWVAKALPLIQSFGRRLER